MRCPLQGKLQFSGRCPSWYGLPRWGKLNNGISIPRLSNKWVSYGFNRYGFNRRATGRRDVGAPGAKKCPSAGNGGRTGNYKTLGRQLFGSLVFGRFFGFGRFRLGGRFRDGGGSE